MTPQEKHYHFLYHLCHLQRYLVASMDKVALVSCSSAAYILDVSSRSDALCCFHVKLIWNILHSSCQQLLIRRIYWFHDLLLFCRIYSDWRMLFVNSALNDFFQTLNVRKPYSCERWQIASHFYCIFKQLTKAIQKSLYCLRGGSSAEQNSVVQSDEVVGCPEICKTSSNADTCHNWLCKLGKNSSLPAQWTELIFPRRVSTTLIYIISFMKGIKGRLVRVRVANNLALCPPHGPSF